MKFTPANDKGASLLTVTGAENCDTDSWPLVPQVFFRHYQGSFDPEMGAVATAVLFSDHCGSVAEFHGARIGIDAARAIRGVAPDVEDVLPLDGMKREIGQGSSALIVGEMDRMLGGVKRGVGKAARAITWSGDFVNPRTRTSSDHIGGDVFTNAMLVASSTAVSVALALFAGGRALRDIYVPAPPKEEEAEFDRIAEGLEFISIKLNAI